MADAISDKQRSANMRAIRSKNTKPELRVRKLIHRMGYRYRLHRTDLPGKPDLVFAGRRKIIFVHGCFWHQHSKCRIARTPQSNQEYWLPKLAGNKARDKKHLRRLKQMGWRSMIFWECEIKDTAAAERKIAAFLEV